MWNKVFFAVPNTNKYNREKKIGTRKWFSFMEKGLFDSLTERRHETQKSCRFVFGRLDGVQQGGNLSDARRRHVHVWRSFLSCEVSLFVPTS